MRLLPVQLTVAVLHVRSGPSIVLRGDGVCRQLADLDEGLDDVGIELRAGVPLQLVDALGLAQCLPVGPIARHGIVGIDHGHPAEKRDALDTLALPKTGLRTLPGELYLADLGIPPEVYARVSVRFVWPAGAAPTIRLIPS